MNDPSKKHMDAVFIIMRYLKGSPGTGLMFKKIQIEKLKCIQMLIGQVM